MHLIRTNRGKGHLVPDLYVEGMVGPVARTICPAMIEQHSKPEHCADPATARNLCKRCRKAYGDGRIWKLLEKTTGGKAND